MVAVLALVVGAAWAVLAWLGDHGRELVNAGAWWWGWLAVPVAAALLGALAHRRGGGPGPWSMAVLLIAPMAVAFVIHDRAADRRPAYWPVGWTLLAVLLAICAAVGLGLARRPPR